MDRFIGVGNDVYYGRNWPLKSNMDRFIVSVTGSVEIAVDALKSNMDRFIVAS